MKTCAYLLTVLLTVFFTNCLNAQSPKKPNVIFILGDDIGFDSPTVNGGQSFSTPNIDSMARYGMNFTHCESTPLCSPSRMMLLTGKQNFRNYSNWGYMTDTAKTMGNLMKDAGYTTGFFGKLQLQCSSARMKNWGWDDYTVFEIDDDTIKNNQRYKSPNLIDNKGRVAESITKDQYCDDILTNRIRTFIDSNKTKPFFIYYSMSIGHHPFCPTPDDPEYAAWDPSKGVSDTSFYPSMMNYMDKKVGQILTKLKSAGLDNNTIVFFAGDNGTDAEIVYKANGVLVTGEKAQTLEGGTHVPLMAYWPKYIAPHSINDDLIDFTDFFPTFADLAGYKKLTKYGVLDGVSFCNRLFKKADSVRPYIFAHYDPHPGGPSVLNRWVRDKVYKLYDDSTGSKSSGKFFNIQLDKEEKHALKTNELTPAEVNLKSTFKHILDTSGSWPQGPLIQKAAASGVTNNSAVIAATIVNSGASRLIERGSTLSTRERPYYDSNRQKDPNIALGTFSQTRNSLMPQKKYFYSLYAMNANLSNSTAYAMDTFITLSNPVIKQPTSFTATDKACSVELAWNNAAFPSSGATKGGYVVVYATKAIVLNKNANGHPPAAVSTNPKNRIITIVSSLPKLPATSTTVSGLSKDSLYYFTLVPYTYDGTNDSTYNYLTDGALSTTKKPANNGCKEASFVSVSESQSAKATLSGMLVTPNPGTDEFTLKMTEAIRNEVINIRVSDALGRTYYDIKGTGKSRYVFGSNLKAGIYFIDVKTAAVSYKFKVVKE